MFKFLEILRIAQRVLVVTLRIVTTVLLVAQRTAETEPGMVPA